MSELPDNVKRIDVLRIEYKKKKLCECNNPHYEIDFQNKLVYCTDCGAIIDPFTVLCNLANHYERISEQTQHLLTQRREIINYKPWLLTFRDLEKQYRSKEMLPCCPECGKAFYFENIRTWVSRKLEELRRSKTSL